MLKLSEDLEGSKMNQDVKMTPRKDQIEFKEKRISVMDHKDKHNEKNNILDNLKLI